MLDCPYCSCLREKISKFVEDVHPLVRMDDIGRMTMPEIVCHHCYEGKILSLQGEQLAVLIGRFIRKMNDVPIPF